MSYGKYLYILPGEEEAILFKAGESPQHCFTISRVTKAEADKTTTEENNGFSWLLYFQRLEGRTYTNMPNMCIRDGQLITEEFTQEQIVNALERNGASFGPYGRERWAGRYQTIFGICRQVPNGSIADAGGSLLTVIGGKKEEKDLIFYKDDMISVMCGNRMRTYRVHESPEGPVLIDRGTIIDKRKRGIEECWDYANEERRVKRATIGSSNLPGSSASANDYMNLCICTEPLCERPKTPEIGDEVDVDDLSSSEDEE